MRSVAATSLVLLLGCGGKVEEEIAPAEPIAAAADPSATVTGSVVLLSGKWPAEPVPGPARAQVVLLSPNERFSLRAPQLADAELVVQTVASEDGHFAVRAPPGEYLIYAVDKDRLANDSSSGRRLGDARIRLEFGRQTQRDLVIYAYAEQ